MHRVHHASNAPEQDRKSSPCSSSSSSTLLRLHQRRGDPAPEVSDLIVQNCVVDTEQPGSPTQPASVSCPRETVVEPRAGQNPADRTGSAGFGPDIQTRMARTARVERGRRAQASQHAISRRPGQQRGDHTPLSWTRHEPLVADTGSGEADDGVDRPGEDARKQLVLPGHVRQPTVATYSRLTEGIADTAAATGGVENEVGV